MNLVLIKHDNGKCYLYFPDVSNRVEISEQQAGDILGPYREHLFTERYGYETYYVVQ